MSRGRRQSDYVTGTAGVVANLLSDLDLEFADQTPDTRRDHSIGVNLIALLDLKLKTNGRVDTAWGDKTPVGLARTVRRIMDGEEGVDL